MNDAVTLRIDGRNFGGWLSIEIARSIEQAAAAFTLGASARYPGETNPVRIRPGSACEVLIGAERVLVGFVDSVAPKLEATAYSLAVAGRSKPADLVDCSAVHTPGRWRKRKIEQIAADLAKPFGVEVVAQVSTGDALPRFALESGETAFEAIERMARLRQLLVTDDAAGRLVLTRAGTGRAEVALEQGANVLAGEAKADASGVFSAYTVRGQRVGDDSDFGEAVAKITGEAADPGLARHRPLVVNAEAQVTKATAKARAAWEAATRLGRSLEASITVQGWRQRPGGALWAPNVLVQVDAPALGLDGEFLISGVALALGPGGSTARLELALPDAYKPEPPTPKSRGASGLWKEIARGVPAVTSSTPPPTQTLIPKEAP